MPKKDSLAECPRCGSDDVYGVTRVVGYFSRIENWLPSKISELIDRKKGVYAVIETEMSPLKMKYGKDGVYLFGKEDCSYCTSEEGAIRAAMKSAGVEDKVNVFVKKIADSNGDIIPENLALAAKMEIPLTRIPAVVFVKDGKIAFKDATNYERGRMITQQELAEKIKSVYANAA